MNTKSGKEMLFKDIGKNMLDSFRTKTMESIDYKTYTIEQMREEHQQYIGEIFFDGCCEKENLKYLAKDEVEGYEKYYSDDCVKNMLFIFESMDRFSIHNDWVSFLKYLVPAEDKRIDYFFHNNPSMQLIMMSLQERISRKWREEIINSKDEVLGLASERKDQFMNLISLSQEIGDDRANDLLKEIERHVKPIIKRLLRKNPSADADGFSYKQKKKFKEILNKYNSLTDKDSKNRKSKPRAKNILMQKYKISLVTVNKYLQFARKLP